MASPERRNSVSTKPAIDREKTTPFLLRLFVRPGGFHRHTLFFNPCTLFPYILMKNILDLKILKFQIVFQQTMNFKFTLGKFSLSQHKLLEGKKKANS